MGSNKLTPKQQRAVEIVQEIGPVASAEVAKLLGCGHERCAMHLRRAANAGAIRMTNKGQYALWYAPKDEGKAWSMVRARLEAVKDARRERARQKYKDWPAKRLKMQQAHEAWAAAMPVHRRIPANEAPPIKPLGPTSVFALGGAA